MGKQSIYSDKENSENKERCQITNQDSQLIDKLIGSTNFRTRKITLNNTCLRYVYMTPNRKLPLGEKIAHKSRIFCETESKNMGW